MSNVIIELTSEVASKLLYAELDMEDGIHNRPFDEFTIAFPTKVILSFEQMMLDIEENVGRHIDPIKDNKAVQEITKYIEANLLLYFSATNDKYIYKLKDSRGIMLFHCEWLAQIPIPIPNIIVNDIAKNKTVFSYNLRRLVVNTIKYINSPVVTKTREKVNKPKSHKKKGGKKSGGKTYIYKTVYRMPQLPADIQTDRRHYERHTESWQVRRFPRHYRNPDGTIRKTVWIEPHVRGKGKTKKSKEYKITRVEE